MTDGGHSSRARRGRAFVGAASGASGVVAITAIAVACSSSPQASAAGLEVIVATDLENPSQYDAIQVEVSQQLEPGTWNLILNETYEIPREARLPTRLAIAPGPSPDQEALIKITAYHGYSGAEHPGIAVVVRSAEVQVPTHEVAELMFFLAANCTGVTCKSGETCEPATGKCAFDGVDVTSLPPYEPADASDMDVGEIVTEGRAPRESSTSSADREVAPDTTSPPPDAQEDAKGGAKQDAAETAGDDATSPADATAPPEDSAPLVDATEGRPDTSPPADARALADTSPPIDAPVDSAESGQPPAGCTAGAVMVAITKTVSSGNFGTAGPVCVTYMGSVMGWNASSVQGRSVTVVGNTTEMPAVSGDIVTNQPGLMPGADGYIYWNWTAGTASYSAMSIF